jgi:Na+/H+-dicarboxylate symporter
VGRCCAVLQILIFSIAFGLVIHKVKEFMLVTFFAVCFLSLPLVIDLTEDTTSVLNAGGIRVYAYSL